MTILVTGGSGLIGRALLSALKDKAIPARYLSTSRKAKPIAGAVPFFWNPSAGTIDNEALSGVDVIIHLAGASIGKRWTNGYKQEIFSSRVDSAKLLLQTILENDKQIKHFISASAVGIYPDSRTQVFTEDSKILKETFLADVVRKWEQAACVFEDHNIKISVLRTGLVLAAEGGALPQMARPVRFGAGAAFGDGKQIQSWIHIEDLVQMYIYIAEKSLAGIFNAVAPQPVTNAELIRIIAKQVKKPLLLPGIPKFTMKVLLGEMHTILYESQHVSSRKILESGFSFRYDSASTAISNLL